MHPFPPLSNIVILISTFLQKVSKKQGFPVMLRLTTQGKNRTMNEKSGHTSIQAIFIDPAQRTTPQK